MTTKEKAAVMLAADAGAEIESQIRQATCLQTWVTNKNPSWNWDTFNYRVKPREPRRIWVNVYGGGVGSVVTTHKTKDAAIKCQREGQSHCVEAVEFVEVVK